MARTASLRVQCLEHLTISQLPKEHGSRVRTPYNTGVIFRSTRTQAFRYTPVPVSLFY
jgi:hypothetical protein